MTDREARRKLNELKKEVWREHHHNRQQTKKSLAALQPARKLKIRALLAGMFAGLITTITYAIVVVLPCLLLMYALGAPRYSLVRQFRASILGMIVNVGGVFVINFVVGYVIAKFAKHAPYYNISILYAIGPLLGVTLLVFALLLNVPQYKFMPDAWDLFRILGGIIAAYIGGFSYLRS